MCKWAQPRFGDVCIQVLKIQVINEPLEMILEFTQVSEAERSECFPVKAKTGGQIGSPRLS